MILVTCGTNEQPFDRLVAAARPLGGDEGLVVQYGASRVPHGRGEWVDFVSFTRLEELMREARVVVCHAGVGSIMLARRCGKRPVVVPRRLHLGEAVDDHQLGLARRLHADGIVTLVESDAELAAAVSASPAVAPHVRRREMPGAAALGAELRAALAEAVIPSPGMETAATSAAPLGRAAVERPEERSTVPVDCRPA